MNTRLIVVAAALAMAACAPRSANRSVAPAPRAGISETAATRRLNEELRRKNETYLKAAQDARGENEQLKARVSQLEATVAQLRGELDDLRGSRLDSYRIDHEEPVFAYQGKSTEVGVDGTFSPGGASISVEPR